MNGAQITKVDGLRTLEEFSRFELLSEVSESRHFGSAQCRLWGTRTRLSLIYQAVLAKGKVVRAWARLTAHQ